MAGAAVHTLGPALGRALTVPTLFLVLAMYALEFGVIGEQAPVECVSARMVLEDRHAAHGGCHTPGSGHPAHR